MRLSLTLALTWLSFASFAQISTPEKIEPGIIVGKVAPMGSFLAELSYQVKGTDTTYTLRFRNVKYSTLVQLQYVQFAEDAGTKDQLYGIMKSVFSDENKKNKDYAVTFKLGEEECIVKRYTGMGSALTFFAKNGWVHLSENQVEKLFGK